MELRAKSSAFKANDYAVKFQRAGGGQARVNG